MDKLYDLIVLGGGECGTKLLRACCRQLAGKQICLVSNTFKCTLGEDYRDTNYAFDKVQANIVYIAYRYGCITLVSDINMRITGKTLILATGSLQEAMSGFYGSEYILYDKVDVKAELNKNKGNLVILGNGATASMTASELSRAADKVFICSSSFELAGRKDSATKYKQYKNIEYLPNCTPRSIRKTECGYSVVLNTYTELQASAILSISTKFPNTDWLNGLALEKNSDDYFLTNEYGQTTTVPNIFAVGSCAKTADGFNVDQQKLLEKLSEILTK